MTLDSALSCVTVVRMNYQFRREIRVKEQQTGKKTVTAADLKLGMYFRHIPNGSLRQLVKVNCSGEGVYHVIDCADGSQGNHGSLEALALNFGSSSPMYELLDEQPVLKFLPVPVKAETTPRPGSWYEDYAPQSIQFVEAEPEPTVTEIQLADGTTIVITAPRK